MDRNLETVGEVLCYLTETTMATLEILKDTKSTLQSEVRRHESIVAMALRNCEVFGLVEAAKKTHCSRIVETLQARVGQTPPNGIQIYYTSEEAACHILVCVMATLSHLKSVKHASKRSIARHETIVNETLLALKKIGLQSSSQYGSVAIIKRELEKIVL